MYSFRNEKATVRGAVSSLALEQRQGRNKDWDVSSKV